MAHMSVEALICPLQGILSIAQREGEQQWRQGKNAFDKWSHVQLRFFMKWFLLWYTYALLLGENLLAKMAFQNIVVVSERRLPILCMGWRKPGTHCYFTRLNPKKMGPLQFCLPIFLGIHKIPKQIDSLNSYEGFFKATLTGHGHPGPY